MITHVDEHKLSRKKLSKPHSFSKHGFGRRRKCNGKANFLKRIIHSVKITPLFWLFIIFREYLCKSMAQNLLKGFLLKETIFSSRNTYKRAVLRAQLSLLGISVGIIYTIIDS